MAAPMNDSTAAAGDTEALRANLERDGYLYLPQLIPRDLVLAGMRAFVEQLGGAVAVAGEGELRLSATAEDVGPDNGIVRPEKADALMAHDRIRAVFGSEPIVALFEGLFGESCVAFDHKWLRVVLPGQSTDFHMCGPAPPAPPRPALLCGQPLPPATTPPHN